MVDQEEEEEEEEGPGLAPASTRTCKACGTKATPQWRRGPLGARTLCNACGVKYVKDQRAAANKASKSPLSGTPVAAVPAENGNSVRGGAAKRPAARPVGGASKVVAVPHTSPRKHLLARPAPQQRDAGKAVTAAQAQSIAMRGAVETVNANAEEHRVGEGGARPASIPARAITVCCKRLNPDQVMWTGFMLPENDWNRGKIVIAGGPDVSYHGVEVTCTEFQNLAGRASTKNWKMSVRKLESHGEPGPQMGDYLREQAKQYGKEYVGRTLSHFWSKEQRWFQAAVESYAETSGAHLLRYAVDGEAHWVYLCMEEFKVYNTEGAGAERDAVDACVGGAAEHATRGPTHEGGVRSPAAALSLEQKMVERVDSGSKLKAHSECHRCRTAVPLHGLICPSCFAVLPRSSPSPQAPTSAGDGGAEGSEAPSPTASGSDSAAAVASALFSLAGTADSPGAPAATAAVEQLLSKRKRFANPPTADDAPTPAEPTHAQLISVLRALSHKMCEILGREETCRMLTAAGETLPR